MAKLDVAIFQGGVEKDKAKNISIMEEQCRTFAKAAKNPLIVTFSEVYLTGYNIGDQLKALAEPADGPSFQAISKIAASLKVGIVYGYPEKDLPTNKVYNSMMFVGDDGKMLVNYRKTHLFPNKIELDSFCPGNKLEAPIVYHGVPLGFLICWDIEFPETIRALRMQGAQVIISHAANTDQFVVDSMIPTRAYENLAYVVYVNRVGRETDVMCGGSLVVAPNGKKLGQLSYTQAEGALVTIDLADPKIRQFIERNPYFQNRFPQQFPVLLTDTVPADAVVKKTA